MRWEQEKKYLAYCTLVTKYSRLNDFSKLYRLKTDSNVAEQIRRPNNYCCLIVNR